MLRIEIFTGGAAFRDEDDNLDETGYEVRRLLTDVKTQIEYGHHSGNLIDINGNKVGYWSYD